MSTNKANGLKCTGQIRSEDKLKNKSFGVTPLKALFHSKKMGDKTFSFTPTFHHFDLIKKTLILLTAQKTRLALHNH